MKIEAAKTPEQIKTINQLAKEIWTEHYTSIIGSAQVVYMLRTIQSGEAIKKQIAEGMHYYIMYDNLEPVGYMGIEFKEEGTFLSKLYVKASQRKKGYAKAALNFLESLTKTQNRQKIFLTVNKDNILAINVYERLGFIKQGSTVQKIGEGFVMDDYLMQKQL